MVYASITALKLLAYRYIVKKYYTVSVDSTLRVALTSQKEQDIN